MRRSVAPSLAGAALVTTSVAASFVALPVVMSDSANDVAISATRVGLTSQSDDWVSPMMPQSDVLRPEPEIGRDSRSAPPATQPPSDDDPPDQEAADEQDTDDVVTRPTELETGPRPMATPSDPAPGHTPAPPPTRRPDPEPSASPTAAPTPPEVEPTAPPSRHPTPQPTSSPSPSPSPPQGDEDCPPGSDLISTVLGLVCALLGSD